VCVCVFESVWNAVCANSCVNASILCDAACVCFFEIILVCMHKYTCVLVRDCVFACVGVCLCVWISACLCLMVSV